MTYSDGAKYEGGWKHGKRHGQGTYTYGKGKWAGDKYEGKWKNDRWHGQGTLTWSNGWKHIGEWKDGKKHGKGTTIDEDGFVTLINRYLQKK